MLFPVMDAFHLKKKEVIQKNSIFRGSLFCYNNLTFSVH